MPGDMPLAVLAESLARRRRIRQLRYWLASCLAPEVFREKEWDKALVTTLREDIARKNEQLVTASHSLDMLRDQLVEFRDLRREKKIDKRTGLGDNDALELALERFLDNDKYAIIFLDLNNFGQINKVFSNVRGNEELEVFAKAVKRAMRLETGSDRLAFRQSGGADEVILIVLREQADRVLRRVYALYPPRLVGKVVIGVSGGIGCEPEVHGEQMLNKLQVAEARMKIAKRRWKLRHTVEKLDRRKGPRR